MKRSKKINNTDCIIYGGYKDTTTGYGILKVRNTPIRVHRILFKIYNPNIRLRKKYSVCHSCDNPSCINLKHLFFASEADNQKDKISKNRQCKGSEVGNSKLKDNQVLEIRRLIKEGKLNYLEISKLFNVHWTTIGDIKRKKSWRHL